MRSTQGATAWAAVDFDLTARKPSLLGGCPLDASIGTRQVTRLFSRNESLSNHRIQSGTGQRDSPARFGQEERRCRPAHHENGPAHFRAKFAAPAYLGAGAEEVCACSRHGARSQDNKQAGRLQGAEESRRNLISYRVCVRRRGISHEMPYSNC